ncbi:MAG: DNA/RNA nuclease SfsA [Thermoplasmata archaeon]|nr:MAG: DNA/RNA nuclease SfsA [Thermoplasmata archaeon]RLF76243.1 MAG: DNA/RNA nuclease SfsA [Thermoplasmata archaeon]
MNEAVIKFSGLKEGRFLERPNRFTAVVDIPGEGAVKAHLHDPGRLEEILTRGRKVLLKSAVGRGRKTQYDVIAGEAAGSWVFIHSGYHRRISKWIIQKEVVEELGKVEELKDEVRWGRSRMDHLLKNSRGEVVLIEVKGCTLTRDGVALFPDAPTERGRRHLEELIRAEEKGMRAAVIFLVFRQDSRCFLPNGETDPAFEEVFFRALSRGVEIYPLLFSFNGEEVLYLRRLPLCSETK